MPRGNVASLLFARELSANKAVYCSKDSQKAEIDTKLEQWLEADSLARCSATYAAFQPAPRSTIALSFNCDGSLLASTHGDHTVKITEYATDKLLRVLSGHRRTPWVVRFHPAQPHLLASGSLDHEVRLWNAITGECIAKHTFGKPIASLAFHPSSPILAIACGHKLYTWEWPLPHAHPTIVLKTKRSMRAVHFHPHGAPLLLTAEVQDPTPTPDLPVSLTDQGPYVLCSLDEHSAGPAKMSEEASVSTAGGWMPPGSSSIHLPTSLIPTGWELPFPANYFTSMTNHLPAVPGRRNSTSLPFNPPPSGSASPPLAVGQSNLHPGAVPQVLAAFSAAAWNIIGEEQPPRVRLKFWSFDTSKPGALLESGLRAQIPDAVLCSEMGVDFSPCGRYMAGTVAAKSEIQVYSGGPEPMDIDESRPERVVFEVRVFSLEQPYLAQPVRAMRIRAAHCLTSVQFSPTGQHLLLAYGKKHISLLRSLVAERGSVLPLHTIMEVFSVKDLSLVGVLPSGDDEINAAAFHPLSGGGLAYGTKEGRLRMLRHDRESESRASSSSDRPGSLEFSALRDWPYNHWLMDARQDSME